MKTVSLFALGLLAAPVLSQAQTGQPVRFGLKAGATLSTIVGPGTSGDPKVSPLVGGMGGVFATVPLGAAQRWFLQPELLYSQQGYRLSHPATEYDARFRSDYLKLPLLLGIARGGFFAAVGPQAGYLVQVRNTYHSQQVSPAGVPLGPTETINTDLRYYRRWEFSAVAAVGYRWHCGAGLELRYSDTFFSQSHDGLSSNYGYPNAHSLSGQIQASYLLPWH
ncbi:PorT family protein [Hymenobacter sp. BRD128]|uniref:porin family protein n=1 Tax=Hymenobacter sp. BRD128 TaxID=2675878 RepID=UPI0015651A33|nr:porin family protein [Hymenobacter sp. BRD128]QKG58335.1 PorT family protein [Hymenobacter sp. BRD128]